MAAVFKDITCLVLLSTVVLTISLSAVQALVTEGGSTKVSTATHPSTSGHSEETDIPKVTELPTQSTYSNKTEYSEQQQSPTKLEENEEPDTGKIAGIIIGVLGGIAIITTMVAFLVYKQYLRRNITSMNFDNPVYRKTTEDQFSLEKNQYQPARSYPPSLEPLTSPGTNEFV